VRRISWRESVSVSRIMNGTGYTEQAKNANSQARVADIRNRTEDDMRAG